MGTLYVLRTVRSLPFTMMVAGGVGVSDGVPSCLISISIDSPSSSTVCRHRIGAYEQVKSYTGTAGLAASRRDCRLLGEFAEADDDAEPSLFRLSRPPRPVGAALDAFVGAVIALEVVIEVIGPDSMMMRDGLRRKNTCDAAVSAEIS